MRFINSLPALVIWLVALGLVLGGWYLVAGAMDSGFARGDGRLYLLYFGVALALHLISRRNYAYRAYGLGIAPGWERLTLSLFAAAALGTGAVLASSVNGITVSRSPISFADMVLASLWIAGITAYLQEVCFRGFLYTELLKLTGRGLVGSTVAVLATSFAFCATVTLDPAWITSLPERWPALAGLFLVGVLLQLVRLAHGTLVAPMGVAGGFLFVEALARRGAIDVGGKGAPDLALLPDGYLQATPAFWIVMAVAIGGYLTVLRRGTVETAPAAGPKPVTGRPSLGARLRDALVRYNPLTNALALARFDVWLRMLFMSRLAIPPLYWPRLLVSLGVSLVVTLINLPERFLAPILLKGRSAPPPVFVVGLHRSGTTMLHTLLALDPRFNAPQLAHVMNPDGFLVFGRALFFFFMPFMPWQRPMDAVTFAAHEPQEDEFALACRSGLSPYWAGVFPRLNRKLDRFIYTEEMSDAEKRAFVDDIRTLLVKMNWNGARVPLLKSPYHAARIRLLAAAFPGARFVYIRRNPTSVYLSSRGIDNFYNMLQVQTPRPGETFADRLVDKHFTKVEAACTQALRDLPEGHTTTVAYEDLSADPEREIKRMYAELGIKHTAEARSALDAHLARHRSYRRNVHPPLTPKLAQRLSTRLAPVYRKGGYAPPVDTSAAK